MTAKNSQTVQKIIAAEIVGVHGVRGWVKMKIFTEDPESLYDFSLSSADGKLAFTVEDLHLHGNIWLAALSGVADRTAAEKLRGVKLYMPREELPEIDAQDTYYHADLIGLAAKKPDGSTLGKVIAVVNFGAGDLLDIKPEKGASFYVPFTNAIVPQVDIKSGVLTVDAPPGLLD